LNRGGTVLKRKDAGADALFAARGLQGEEPLASRLRPRTLEEFVGQEHILGPGRLLRRAIQADQLSSLIFYGPPGTGKTTLARVIANTTRSRFESLNAVLAGVKEIREVTARAEDRRQLHGQRAILFVDEVHRWNKAQQDALLPWVENGTVVFIGATTLNPFFEVNPALVSRSRIFQLKPLGPEELHAVARAALQDRERGYGRFRVNIDPPALEHLVDVCGGDARTLLNALELAVETTPVGFPPPEGQEIRITLPIAEESIQRRVVLYDKEGDYHFDTISAFIKSLRGSDPDAALYWLARMVYAGEDPRFIFRRLLIFAAEDVGLADPQALVVTEAAAAAFERVGLPEGRFHLAQAVLYLATAAKSNTTMAFFDALDLVEKQQAGEVPAHLRDASRDKEGFGHGEGYLYPHAYREHWVAQQYLPDALQGKVFYQPSDQGYEAGVRERVARRREAQLAAMLEAEEHPREILTFTPPGEGRDPWVERAVSRASEELAAVRDRIFASLSLARHHVVLDLSAGDGLLTWEALRRVPEGGVWARVEEQAQAALLAGSAQALGELERPHLLTGALSELPELLAGEAAPPVFDALVGRDVLLREPDKRSCLRLLASLLRPGGRLSLAETVPALGSRLSELVDFGSAGDLAGRVAAAEKRIYANPEDPLVNWTPEQLRGWTGEQGLEIRSWELQQGVLPRSVRRADVDRWFEEGLYGTQLRRLLGAEELLSFKALCTAQIAGREMPWRRFRLYLAADRG
jgi:putative ATPase